MMLGPENADMLHDTRGPGLSMDIMDIHGENASSWARYTHLVGKYPPIGCIFPWIN